MEKMSFGLAKNKKEEDLWRYLIAVNNVRFLILPWVKVKNLGSKILGFAVKVVPIGLGEDLWGEAHCL